MDQRFVDPRNEFVNIDESQTQYVIENVVDSPFFIRCYLVIPSFEIAVAKEIRSQERIVQVDKSLFDVSYEFSTDESPLGEYVRELRNIREVERRACSFVVFEIVALTNKPRLAQETQRQYVVINALTGQVEPCSRLVYQKRPTMRITRQTPARLLIR